jgi:hypothetical protein
MKPRAVATDLLLRLCVLMSLLLSAVLMAGCGERSAEDRSAHPFEAVIDTADFMNWILDPAADVIWGSAGTISTIEGDQDLTPVTDEAWDAVRNAGALIAESGNLLMLPGRAPDQQDWVEYSQAMIAMGRRAMAAADARDGVALFDIGGQLYNLCLACHQRYIDTGPDGTGS